MNSDESRNFAIKMSHTQIDVRVVAVVKGITAANLTVERYMRKRSAKIVEAGVTYFHDKTTLPLTTKPKKPKGTDRVRSMTSDRRLRR
jgi:hypothetical protein